VVHGGVGKPLPLRVPAAGRTASWLRRGTSAACSSCPCARVARPASPCRCCASGRQPPLGPARGQEESRSGRIWIQRSGRGDGE